MRVDNSNRTSFTRSALFSTASQKHCQQITNPIQINRVLFAKDVHKTAIDRCKDRCEASRSIEFAVYAGWPSGKFTSQHRHLFQQLHRGEGWQWVSLAYKSNLFTLYNVHWLCVFCHPPELTNAFRGYPLDGCQFAVPSHLQGVVFQELNRPLEENVDRTFKVNGIFHDFTYWNYDRDPSENDMLRQALQWADFAKVVSDFLLCRHMCVNVWALIQWMLFMCFQLHAPITKEQFEGSTKNAEEEVDVKKENDIKMEENWAACSYNLIYSKWRANFVDWEFLKINKTGMNCVYRCSVDFVFVFIYTENNRHSLAYKYKCLFPFFMIQTVFRLRLVSLLQLI